MRRWAVSINDLPDEMIASVFRWLSCVQVITRAAKTCARWRSVCLDPANQHHLCTLCPIKGERSSQPPRTIALCRAVAAGHTACAKDLVRNGSPTDGALVPLAAYHPHTDIPPCLAHDYYRHEDDTDPCYQAAKGGHLKCLRLLHETGWRWNEETLRVAVAKGHVDCVNYILSVGCIQERHDFEICYGPPTPAHFACVKEIVDAGVHMGDFGDMAAVESGHFDCLRLFGGESRWDEEVCAIAARRGDLPMLRHLHENAWDWDKDTVQGAIESGNRGCVAYALASGCPWEKGHLCDMIRADLWPVFALAVKADATDNRPSVAAASLGRLDALRDICDSGWLCDQETCAEAARANSLGCLDYLYDRGCAWDQQTCHAALVAGSRACFEYAASRGCPMDAKDRSAAAERGWLVGACASPPSVGQLTRTSTASQRRRRRRRAREAKIRDRADAVVLL
ncbi:Ankyrin repeat domain containing protein [Pandoravirus neocaledonia]|uniref:Ankyrin repeat domain containing protein n=1 Tax=Pandoravirus neocaledonia TaxID=2107708 RepID=A0A2U7UDF2_9VIRU|nr:Ankyrin repeat domain containing protein [Pandoravirus neocaledonia]AVK76385.1 Ankyrin repeat domain containing protein [Pandoravirus neocaledonia]